MNRGIAVLTSVTLGAVALDALPALAQTASSTQDVQVYGGYQFGDRLLSAPISGSTPRLNGSGTFGGRYTYHFLDQLGAQLGAGYSPAHTGHTASGDSDLGLTTVDLDLVWDIPLDFQLAGHKLAPYTVAGVGYAWADLKHPIRGFAGSTPVSITDGNGYTANAGLGLKYDLTDNVFINFDARYRYYSRLVNDYGQHLNTAETSLGVGYRF